MRGDVEGYPQPVVEAVEGEGRVEVDQVRAVAAEQPREGIDVLPGVVVARALIGPVLDGRNVRRRVGAGIRLQPDEERRGAGHAAWRGLRVGPGRASREDRSESARRPRTCGAGTTVRQQLTHDADRRPPWRREELLLGERANVQWRVPSD